MNVYRILFLWVLLAKGTLAQTVDHSLSDANFISYTVNPREAKLKLYWKDDTGHILGSIKNLKSYVESKKAHLIFAMNGGMYKADQSPQGLFIKDRMTLSPIDTASGKGNFYLKPNGIFYISKDGRATICETQSFRPESVSYATQSGPMLVCDSEINTAFKKGSENLNIRNGVGILPDGRLIFAISKVKVNFYDFAMYFKNLGCRDALYLDGFVSRMYLPEQGWEQQDGNFGVLIGVVDK